MTWEIPRFAVIATHNRPVELRECIEALASQVNMIIVVDNASDPSARSHLIPEGWDIADRETYRLMVVEDGEQPPNLSRLWNVGLNLAPLYLVDAPGVDQENRAWNRYDVAVVNDDALPPPGWFDTVAGAMRAHGCDAASSDPFDRLGPGDFSVWRADAPMSVETRLAGWAHILRGEWDGARYDERLRWWTGDDDISLRARQAGGLVHVGGFPVPNRYADQSTTGVLAEQAAKDMQTFVDIHGRRPW